jgi:O-antigen/teichoic acid export membrane protein
MHLATKVAYNTIVQIISKVVTTALGLLVVAVMTRYLGTAGFGEYVTIITFLSFFGIMADLGLTLVTVQMISCPGADEKKILDNLFSLRFISALIFILPAPLVALTLSYNGEIKIGIAIAAASFIFTALSQIFVAIFQKNLRMDKVSIAETAGRVILLVGVVIAAKFDFGLYGMMMAIVAANAIQFFILFLSSFKFARLRFAFDFSLWREVLQKSWPLALTIIFNLLYLKTDTLILSLIKSEDEVGLYGAAYKVIEILTMIPFMFAGVVLPILTLDWAKNDHLHFRAVAQKSFDLMVMLAMPLIIGTQFLAKPVIVLVAGKEFAAAGSILQILIVAAGFVFFSVFLSHVIVAVGAQRKIIWAYFFTAITSVLGYLIFIPKFSYFGAASVTVYSEAAITVFMVFYAWRCAEFIPKLKIFLKSLIASLIMCGVLFIIPANFYDRIWGLILTLLLASVVYFIILYLEKGLTRKDFLRLLNREPDELLNE